MNFKPTTAKIIASILFGLVLGYFAMTVYNEQLLNQCKNNTPPLSEGEFYLGCDDISYLNGVPLLITFISSILIIYAIWSLVSKKILN